MWAVGRVRRYRLIGKWVGFVFTKSITILSKLVYLTFL
jgi:hypothetical protein